MSGDTFYTENACTDFPQLQQLDFVSERKRWESKKAQEAPPPEDDAEEERESVCARNESTVCVVCSQGKQNKV